MQLREATLVGVLAGGLLTGILAAGPAAASDDAKSAGKEALCELRIEGQSITSLKIEGTKRSVTTASEVLRLPAGWYCVSEVTLEGGYKHHSPLLFPRGEGAETWFRLNAGAFELTPGRPYTLKVGGPLLPTAKVSRQGKCLELDYDLVDAGGRSYQNPRGRVDRSAAPGFAVYKGEQKLGSGTFEYG